MKKLITLLFLFNLAYGQDTLHLDMFGGGGITGKNPAANVGIGIDFKRVNIGAMEVVPMTNNSDRNVLFVPYIGYNIGSGFIPYGTYHGGGLMYQGKKYYANIGIQNKHGYFIAGMNLHNQSKPVISNSTIRYSLMFISGMADGMRDVCSYHPQKIKEHFPTLSDSYWLPTANWNKSDFILFSPFKNIQHTSSFIQRSTLITAGIITTLNMKGQPFLVYLWEGLKMWGVERFGHNLVYNIIFK